MAIAIKRNRLKHWRKAAECLGYLQLYAQEQLNVAADNIKRMENTRRSAYSEVGMLIAEEVGDSDTDRTVTIDAKRIGGLREGLRLTDGAVAEAVASYDITKQAIDDPEFFLTLEGTTAWPKARWVIKNLGATGYAALYDAMDKAPAGLGEKMKQLDLQHSESAITRAIGEGAFGAARLAAAIEYSLVRLSAMLEEEEEVNGLSRRKRKISRRYRKVYRRAIEAVDKKGLTSYLQEIMPAKYKPHFIRTINEAKAAAKGEA